MNCLNPKWKYLCIPLMELCDGDYNMKLTINVYDYDTNSRDDFIGSADVG